MNRIPCEIDGKMWAVSGTARCRSHGGLRPKIEAEAALRVAAAKRQLTNQLYTKDNHLSSNTEIKDFKIGDRVRLIPDMAAKYGKEIRTVEAVKPWVDLVWLNRLDHRDTWVFGYEYLEFAPDDDTLKEEAATDFVLAKLDQSIRDAEQRLQALRDARSEVIRLA